ncbi:MAG: PilZ domain-containing protein [Deltaproteobacteria bacterium]|nr:PilZ domain-containing protein [Deltaproteobacteria bacterium]MDQ3298912.1 PilZ domain-containing protein [Myxococcota bacterium]
MVILKLRIRSADEWRELVPGDLVSETVFVPTTDELEAGQDVIIEVASQLLPNKVLIRGNVQTWRPALPRMRVRAGATIELAADEQTKLTFLHEVFSGKRTDVPRRRHHRLPVSVTCRYRLTNSSSYIESAISEIGVGGALLTTPEPLPIDTELTLEVVPPGGAAAIAIAGRVSYHVPTGGSGLRFVSRDGDGDRRLRELIRRLRAS